MILQEKINENLKGIVCIYENDKLIMQKHNLIVNDGRKFIKDKFQSVAFLNFGNVTPIAESDKNYSSYAFYSLKIGGGTGRVSNSEEFAASSSSLVTTNNMTYNDISSHVIRDLTKYLYDTGDNISKVNIWHHPDERYFKFAVDLKAEMGKSYSISEIFLTFKETKDGSFTSDENEYLFSRVTFDPRVLNAGQSYKIVYYIYF